MPLTAIPACHGIATRVLAGQTIKIINTHGTQIVDIFAFTLSSPIEIKTQLSIPHSVSILGSTIPRVGDGLVDNERTVLLRMTNDTTKGQHDMLIAACDRWRYEALGAKGHRNCADNLVEGLDGLGITPPLFTPSPLNLFMNVPINEDRSTFSFQKCEAEPGQYVSLKAEVDLVIVFSACPQDIVKINGDVPRDAHFEIS